MENVRDNELPVCYDWFQQEQKKISQLEQAKRKAADLLFLERIARELRRGNRNALIADIKLPGAKGTTLRLVNVHLENKCKAVCRDRQMARVLEEVSDTTYPLVLGGDLNTTGTDGTPTSIRYELASRLSDYQFWVGTLLHFSPVGLPAYATAPFGFWKNFRDPTAPHIPILGSNPEAALFSRLRRFRFADGGAFDFNGIAARNQQRSTRTLSDSNERARKGFTTTFSMQRDYGGLIKYRLDWLFVKPKQSGSSGEALTLQPRMPLTLSALNAAPRERLSDHAPITVELPIE